MQWKTMSRLDFPLFIACLLPFITSAGILSPTYDLAASKRPTSNYGIRNEDLESAVQFAYEVTNLSERLESNIKGRVTIEEGSPSFGLNIAYRPEGKAMERGRQALIVMHATVNLANTFCVDYNLDYDDCFHAVKKFSLKKSSLGSVCGQLETVCTPEEYRYAYRSAEGTCNNVKKGALGESFTGYSRLLPPDYSDSINVVRRARAKDPLPNARKISAAIIDSADTVNDRLTLAVPLWGQFLEHDLSRFASSMMYHHNVSFDCCDKDGHNLAPRYQHPLCMAVKVPEDDEYYSALGLRCMSYARSLPAIPHDCHFGWINQLNQASHFLDGSQIYGTTFEKTWQLRNHSNGMLDILQIGDKHYLPLSQNPTEDCQVKTDDAVCFVSGDPRANQHAHLAAMHTLWAREHNRLAAALAQINDHWDDETLFQEARRIVAAEMQHITYDEWASKILGEKGIEFIDAGNGYAENSDPTVGNSFATAAIRSLGSMFRDHLRLVGEDRENADSPSSRFDEHFNEPEIILKVDVLDSLIRGLASQNSGNVDRHYAKYLTADLFGDEHFGYDTLSLDIQRGRDHGLPSYNAFRHYCGLGKAGSIKKFQDHMTASNAELLASLYASPDDVDLIVGGLMEEPRSGSAVGPTLACLLEDQLLRTRRGDRYFYTNDGQPKPFSAEQLQEIQKVSLARIFCDNSDGIEKMQPDVFLTISSSNDLVGCNSDAIPRMDLMLWQDARYSF